MQLNKYPAKPYSTMEYRMFELMPKNGNRVDINWLVDARVKMGNWAVANPRNTITVTMNNLIEKVKANKEAFRIKKARVRPTHHKLEYWIESK